MTVIGIYCLIVSILLLITVTITVIKLKGAVEGGYIKILIGTSSLTMLLLGVFVGIFLIVMINYNEKKDTNFTLNGERNENLSSVLSHQQQVQIQANSYDLASIIKQQKGLFIAISIVGFAVSLAGLFGIFVTCCGKKHKLLTTISIIVSVVIALLFLALIIISLIVRATILSNIDKMCDKTDQAQLECTARQIILMYNRCNNIQDTTKQAKCILETNQKKLLQLYKDAASGWIYLAVCTCLFLFLFLGFESTLTIVQRARNKKDFPEIKEGSLTEFAHSKRSRSEPDSF
ncbi:MAG: hypothetical protein EZS28_003638 [Streblomastix strix]|uniref:Tetraspanin family protein n=1 Tax=Streblomastix strix TaxID=222440 RepID=A0A5J4X0W2_9EUKA|nr:MAG: hypothetical protein EZS28_003638 [Streblomastix strix]